jgi:hypothetical protein
VDQLNRTESWQRLEILLSQIRKAPEHGDRVVIHGNFNLDLDWSDDDGFYMGPCSSPCLSARPARAWRHTAPARRSDRLAVSVLWEEVTNLHRETP